MTFSTVERWRKCLPRQLLSSRMLYRSLARTSNWSQSFSVKTRQMLEDKKTKKIHAVGGTPQNTHVASTCQVNLYLFWVIATVFDKQVMLHFYCSALSLIATNPYQCTQCFWIFFFFKSQWPRKHKVIWVKLWGWNKSTQETTANPSVDPSSLSKLLTSYLDGHKSLCAQPTNWFSDQPGNRPTNWWRHT